MTFSARPAVFALQKRFHTLGNSYNLARTSVDNGALVISQSENRLPSRVRLYEIRFGASPTTI